MAKRYDKNNKNNKLERTITRNWIICIITGVLIIVLMFSLRG